MHVLITGSEGFVGQHLCPELVRDGVSVRALIRGSSRSTLFSGVEFHSGDLTDENAVRAATDGVDAIVHLAARVHVMRDTAADPLAEFRRVNVEGTRLLKAAARHAGVKHMIFASSVKAVGDLSTERWTSITTALPKDAYGISKREAEKLLLAAGPNEEPVVTVLRFPLMYGPGMKGNMLRLFQIINRGFPVPVGSRPNRRSLLYVGNAVAAIMRVISRVADQQLVRPAPGPFFVADGPGRSTEALARNIATALRASSRTVRVPEELLRGVARISDPLTDARLSDILNRLFGSLEVDECEFEREYDFRPPYTTEAAMEITARWFRQS